MSLICSNGLWLAVSCSVVAVALVCDEVRVTGYWVVTQGPREFTGAGISGTLQVL